MSYTYQFHVLHVWSQLAFVFCKINFFFFDVWILQFSQLRLSFYFIHYNYSEHMQKMLYS